MLAILAILGLGIREFLPYSWGNMQLNSKLSFIQENKLDPNLYFIGSSISNRQIMPTLFDSIIGDPQLESFNLSVDGTMPPHHFYLFDNLIKEDKTIEHVFMELDGFDHMPQRHFKTTSSKFYLSPKWFGFSVLNLALSRTIAIEQKLFMSYKYLRSFFENLFFVGMRYDALKAVFGRSTFSYRVIKRHSDGFMYFNTNYTENKVQLAEKDKILSGTISRFSEAYAKKPHELKTNFVYKTLLKRYLQKANKNGINLHFILSPRSNVLISAEELLDIRNSLPQGKVIDLADPIKYRDLYNTKLRFDADHLNGQGAKLYTTYLAELFLESRTNTN